jgi:hypothetical protein
VADNADNQNLQPGNTVDEERRSFLKTSIYAAYATPVITALLVEDANAAPSCTGRLERFCQNFPERPICKRLCGT